jgi:HEAT repeat protein
MPLRSAALPIRDLVRTLASTDRHKLEAAKARLIIQGARAVEALVEALEGGNDRLKLQAMPLLALIRDARAREPLIAMLRDREPKIREAAARALSRFPSRETIACLERVLKTDMRAEVRVAAVQSLATIFDEGHEAALEELLGVLFDPEESRRVRLAAFAVLPLLSLRQRRAVLKKLRDDPDEEIAARAAGLEDEAVRTEPDDDGAISRLTIELASTNHARWNDALHRLIALGSRSLPYLVTAMRARHKDPEFASRAAMVLKGLGPRRLRPVVDYLDSVVEPLPLEVLIDVVASLDDRPLTYRLRDVLDSLDARRASVNGFAGQDPYARVRGRAHLALARIGSRVAVADLKKTLCDPLRRVDSDLLTALAKIGTRGELPDLLRAHRREDPWMKARIRDVFWQIVRREKIRRSGSLFRSLGQQDRQALHEIIADRRATPPSSPTLPGIRLPRRAPSRSH